MSAGHPAKAPSSTLSYNEIPKYRSPYGPKLKPQPRLYSTILGTLFTPEILMRWSSSLAVWGGATLLGLLYVGSKVPVVRNDILKNIPFVRGYFIRQDDVPESDKAF